MSAGDRSTWQGPSRNILKVICSRLWTAGGGRYGITLMHSTYGTSSVEMTRNVYSGLLGVRKSRA